MLDYKRMEWPGRVANQVPQRDASLRSLKRAASKIPTTKSARTADIATLAVQAKADAAALGIPIIAAPHMSAFGTKRTSQ
jgi:hypothetical protein